jgi:hypothetical protein
MSQSSSTQQLAAEGMDILLNQVTYRSSDFIEPEKHIYAFVLK